MILHIDMDAFFASIEQAINPRLKVRPLIVGSRPDKLRTVVCAASYEAKAKGISSGMPSAQAFKICPELEFVAAQQGKYIWTSEQILEMLKKYNLPLNYASIDEFQLDIGNHQEPQAFAQLIQREIIQTFKITASLGIAKNCLLAKLASKLNKPNGIAVISEGNLSSTLAAVEVGKLCGIGQASARVLRNLGIETCLDLYEKSASFLQGAFGKNGLNFHLSLHSEDSFQGPETAARPSSLGHSYTLPRPIQTPGFIQAWLRLLAEMVCRRLRQNNLISHTVHLWLSGPEIGNFRAQKTFRQATADGYEVFYRALKIYSQVSFPRPKIRALGITCAGLAIAEYPALFKEERRRMELLKVLDRINDRY